jgi:hypothetical protein
MNQDVSCNWNYYTRRAHQLLSNYLFHGYGVLVMWKGKLFVKEWEEKGILIIVGASGRFQGLVWVRPGALEKM